MDTSLWMDPTVLRLLRLRIGVTQEEMGRKAGVHPVTIAKWELGKLTPDSEHRADLVMMARQYGVDLRAIDAVLVILRLQERSDPETEQHSIRVSRLTEVVARRMDLDVYSAAVSGLLHDVGKVHLPRAVMEYKGRLTPQERRLLSDHVHGGESIARLVAGDVVARAVAEHHERIDGEGYPRGIEGSEISMLGRILGAVDELDARTWKRVYRRVDETPAAVLEQMEASPGHDPEVVRTLRAVVKDEAKRVEPKVMVAAA